MYPLQLLYMSVSKKVRTVPDLKLEDYSPLLPIYPLTQQEPGPLRATAESLNRFTLSFPHTVAFEAPFGFMTAQQSPGPGSTEGSLTIQWLQGLIFPRNRVGIDGLVGVKLGIIVLLTGFRGSLFLSFFCEKEGLSSMVSSGCFSGGKRCVTDLNCGVPVELTLIITLQVFVQAVILGGTISLPTLYCPGPGIASISPQKTTLLGLVLRKGAQSLLLICFSVAQWPGPGRSLASSLRNCLGEVETKAINNFNKLVVGNQSQIQQSKQHQPSHSPFSTIWCASSKEMRSAGSLISISLTSFSSTGCLSIFTQNFLFSILSIIFCSERSFLDISNGRWPVHNSYIVTPTLQTSHLLISFILTPLRISGAMYCGVPAKVTLFSVSTICVANPKSAILIWLSLMSMLAGLMSRCTKSLEEKYWQAEMICFAKAKICSSLRSKKCCWMYFSRSDSQYSKKRQRLLVVYQISRNWTMLGCLRLCRALYSSCTRFTKQARLDYSTFSMSCFWITLHAQGYLQFLSLQALQAVAKPPRPRHWSIFMQQFPTRLFFYFIVIIQAKTALQQAFCLMLAKQVGDASKNRVVNEWESGQKSAG